jgi:hypothetical protein
MLNRIEAQVKFWEQQREILGINGGAAESPRTAIGDSVENTGRGSGNSK